MSKRLDELEEKVRRLTETTSDFRMRYIKHLYKEETAPQGCKCYGPGKILHVPDLPLNVRVAKALGPDWLELPHDKYPNYDSDLTLAMGALEEYCEKEHIYTEISVFDKKDKYKYFCGLYEYGNVEGLEMTTADHLPTAICEAIVKHKEGK